MDELFSCHLDSQSLGSTYSDSNDSTSDGQSLFKVEPEGDFAVLFLLVSERPDLYYLEVTDGLDTWTGSYPHSNVKKIAQDAKMAESNVALETKQALTGKQGSQSEYHYTAAKSQLGVKNCGIDFTWKKQLALNDDIKFTLGSVFLEPCSDKQLQTRLLNFSVTHMSRLQQTILDLKKDKQQLATDRAGVLKRLEECVNIKEEIEGELYGKFKLVLNEKKAKIRRLMESLNRQKGGGARKSNNDTSSTPPQTTLSTDEEVSDNDTKTRGVATTPSPKRKKPVEFTGTSLLHDEEGQEDMISPPLRKRKRTKNSATTGTQWIHAHCYNVHAQSLMANSCQFFSIIFF